MSDTQKKQVPWEVAMGFLTQEQYDEMPDDHPGDDHWSVNPWA